MRRASHFSLAAALSLITILAAMPSARADGYRDDWRGRDWHHDEWREREWHRGHPYPGRYLYAPPPPVVFVPQPRYYSPPPAYYSPGLGYYGY